MTKTDKQIGQELRDRLNKSHDTALIKMAKELTDDQLFRLQQLVKAGY